MKALPATDSLIKGSTDAVYYYAADGKRYVFPNENIYYSWFSDFSNITQVTDQQLAQYSIGEFSLNL